MYKGAHKRLEEGIAIQGNYNYHYTLDYDEKTVIKKLSYDSFCKRCRKPFYYMSNLSVTDIRYLTVIIDTGRERWKYVINFNGDESYYSIDHNYLTKQYKTSLTPARRIKILDMISDTKFLNWKPLTGKNNLGYNVRWIIDIEYNNEQTFSRGGYDEYPPEWNDFMDAFYKIFKNDIFQKCKVRTNK